LCLAALLMPMLFSLIGVTAAWSDVGKAVGIVACFLIGGYLADRSRS